MKDKDYIKTLEQEVEYLWKLLDSIDTAGDSFKPEWTPYAKYVQRICERRFEIRGSDGYVLINPHKEIES